MNQPRRSREKIYFSVIVFLIIVLGYSFSLIRTHNNQIPDTTESPTAISAKCTRTEPYPTPPEFRRSISLIKQRYGEHLKKLQSDPNFDFRSYIPSQWVVAFVKNNVENCLDIQYAASDTELDGAEGVFSFSRESTPEKLSIKVSPRYKVKDDLLTSLLISHEIIHATNFAAKYPNTRFTQEACYNDETLAFTFQIIYVGAVLNQEEVKSLITRYDTPEIAATLRTLGTITEIPGSTASEKASTFVRRNSAYIQQCRSLPKS